MSEDKCAPHLEYEDGSCIPLNLLIKIVDAYNLEYPNEIPTHHELELTKPKEYRQYLIHALKSKLSNISQTDWHKQKFAKRMNKIYVDELKDNTFRPKGYIHNEWLNSLQIEDVMKQYEKKYEDFKYLGTVPIDFDDIPELGIRDLNFGDLVKEGKTKIGMTINSDSSRGPGIHWFSMFADLKTGEICFFDSTSDPPVTRIKKFMKRIANFCRDEMGVTPHTKYNDVKHQYGNSECGVYSINFILRMLKGDKFEDICESKIPDKRINKCRKVYFGNGEE